MIITITRVPDIDAIVRKFEGMESQIPFALSQTINVTLKQAKEALQAEIKRVFDRPTPMTMNSIKVFTASKRTLTGTIFVRDEASKGTPPSRYLFPEIEGGERKGKRFELAMRAKGILTGNLFVAPGAAAGLDQYGNVSRGRIMQIMSTLQATHDPYQWETTASLKRKRRGGKRPARYFVGRPGGGSLPLGVWQRMSHGVKPIFLFVKKPHYSKRFKFFNIVQAVIDNNLLINFKLAFETAVKNAR